MRMFRKNEKGMTLIELLIVVAIIGVLSAIAIVNYLVALDKSKQKKSMADMRSIASAWEARATDKGGYGAAGANVITWPSQEFTHNDMVTLLSPTYIRPLAKNDGWGTDFGFAVEPRVGESATYAIRSAGRDRIFESVYDVQDTERFDCDLVFSDGVFVVRPLTK